MRWRGCCLDGLSGREGGYGSAEGCDGKVVEGSGWCATKELGTEGDGGVRKGDGSVGKGRRISLMTWGSRKSPILGLFDFEDWE